MGVPISRDELSKKDSKELIETNHALKIIVQDLHKEDEEHKGISWEGSLDECTMQCAWEIACLGMNEKVELTTCSFKQQHSINTDRTLPCLQNSNEQVIH